MTPNHPAEPREIVPCGTCPFPTTDHTILVCPVCEPDAAAPTPADVERTREVMGETTAWTEAACGDGAAILRDGVPVSIADVLETLNGASDEIERLRDHLDPEAYLLRAGKPPGSKTGFEFAVSSPIVRIIANHMAAMLKAHGAENYVELGFAHEALGPLTLVVQRDRGDTPARKVAERDAEIETKTTALRRAREIIARDRNGAWESFTTCGAHKPDVLEAEVIAEYDAVLALIDGVLNG